MFIKSLLKCNKMANEIKIVCIGKIKEKYIDDAIKEYKKRLTAFCKLEIIELKDKGLKEEKETLKEYIDENTFILDEKGKEFASVEFSKIIKKETEKITFIIGGHDGISEDLKKENKDKLFSLSKMTLTHEMARLFLIEQIYRSFMIINNRKYHR